MEVSDSPVLENVQTAEAPAAVEQEQASAPAEEASSDQVDANAEDDGENAGATETPKRKNGFERRVQKLNDRAREAQLEAEFWKTKALGATSATAPTQTSTEKPKFSDFNDIDAYTDAVTDWKLERKLQEFQQAQQQQTVQKTYVQREAEFKKTALDFDEVMDDIAHIKFPPIVLNALSESDIGPAVAYELARNSSEAERISRLPPLQQVKELGKLEERLTRARTTSVAKTETKAPPPMKPATGKGAKVLDISDPNISFEDFKRLRQEQLRAKKR